MSNKQLGIFFDSVIPQFVEQRKKLGLSQSRLDEMIGCARGLVSKWEVGIRKPNARRQPVRILSKCLRL